MTRTRSSYPELQRRSPHRPPAWRWERALDLVRLGKYVSARRDDEATARAVRYLRARRRCRRESQVQRLANTYPDVHQAHQLAEHGGSTVVKVQARLLARQSFDEIAHGTSVPVGEVRIY